MSHPLLELATRRIVVLDGAMGTEIQRRAPSPGDFRGAEGCNEVLVESRPDLVLDIHRSYLDAGADVIETDSFGANAVVLREYGLASRVFELNRAAASLARQAADEASTPDRPRFVAGSVGPGTRLPSLGQATFGELRETFRDQVAGLLAGGVDAVQVETCQDPLQARAACTGANDAMEAAGRRVPLLVLVTVERNGTMLLGTEPGAAVVTLASLPGVDAFGINCATGPESMYPVLRRIASVSPLPLVVMPNAGLPENEGGTLVYRLTPGDFARHVVAFVSEFGAAFVGGCCGTTPAHIAALAGAVAGLPAPVGIGPSRLAPAASSLYQATTLRQEPLPLILGERTNANGSKEFRDRLQAGDLDGMVAVAVGQQNEGAHLLDVSLALAGRPEAADAAAFVARLRETIELPLVYDSTEPDAIEVALESWPGRAVVNSVNLEDGGARLEKVAAIARRHGAALVVLTIDEAGMAMTADAKVAVAQRAAGILCDRFGFAPCDLLVDPLTFTLASGDATLRDSAVQTLAAIRRIKEAIPGALTSLGLSNVSFGLKPPLRRVLNSVFLHHAVEAGLDAAILNAGKVVPLSAITPEHRRLAEDLLFGRYKSGDPLHAFIAAFEGAGPADDGRPGEAPAAVSERLRRRVVRGDRSGLEADLEEALLERPPLAIVNEVLLEGMKEVGDLFGRGEMQLPFVLKSAEVVKAAVRFLEPRMERGGGACKGTLVLATVAGDVHDIGKNLVDILLSNNGYRVVNLGIRQPIEAVLEAATRESADAIGLSGLLVKSTVVMRDAAVEMRRRGVSTPLLLGGAALNERFVDEEVRPRAAGPVAYCADAFAGLKAMDELAAGRAPQPPRRPAATPRGEERPAEPEVVPAVAPPATPFLGTRIEESPPVGELATYVNRVALFRGQWQFRKGRMTDDEWRAYAADRLEPMFRERLERYVAKGVLAPRAIWGFLAASADGDAVRVLDGDAEVARFAFPRQPGGARLCLADFLLPGSSGRRDVIGVQLATVGPGASRREGELFDAGDFAEYLYLHGIAVELAEATAEWAHRRIREAWGIADEDARDREEVLRKGYRGCRYSFGYPACPALEDQRVLLRLLGADRLGVTLTEQLQMVPEQSTSAIVFHHPAARYFIA
jgi:5-methyltetrahydrofolate--homocysteine methyltransferase